MATITSTSGGYTARFVAEGRKEQGHYRITVHKSKTLVYSTHTSVTEKKALLIGWLAELSDAELKALLDDAIEYTKSYISKISDLDTKLGIER